MEDVVSLDVGNEALDLLTVREAAERLRLSPSTIRRLIGSGDLEAVHIGRLVRVAPEALAEYKGHLREVARSARTVLVPPGVVAADA